MQEKRPVLLGMAPAELERLLQDLGEQRFRAQQVAEWIYQKGAATFDEMSNLSLTLREKLSNETSLGTLSVAARQQSHRDPVTKLLLELSDGQRVESVVMRYNYGNSVCVSSQVGCKMGCGFCASGLSGFTRNLTAGEMVGQVLAMYREIGQRISHIVLMGMGEPLDNYDEVIKFMAIANAPWGLGIGYRHIALSTCGIVPRIRDLAKEGIPINLSVSLHAPNDEIRRRLMPISQKYPINELLKACREYADLTHRRITFEYSLVQNQNDRPEHAKELATRLRGMLCHVNLIPVNLVAERGLKRSRQDAVQAFAAILQDAGIETTIRREMGSDIDAACGQLRQRIEARDPEVDL